MRKRINHNDTNNIKPTPEQNNWTFFVLESNIACPGPLSIII